MVPRLEVGPELLWWELQVQTAGLTDNLRPQGISIGVSLPEVLISAPRPSSIQLPANSSAGRLRPNKQYDRNTAPPIKKKNMKRQKNMLQTKEQGKNLQDQINEDEIGNLPEKEFRVMIVKMIQNLRNRMEKIQETFNKDLEE